MDLSKLNNNKQQTILYQNVKCSKYYIVDSNKWYDLNLKPLSNSSSKNESKNEQDS